MKSILTAILVCFGVVGVTVAQERVQGENAIPAAWRAAWSAPAAGDRPLQIVHGLKADANAVRRYQDLGLGGVVCNVAFENYLESEAKWRELVASVETLAKRNLIVWIYDEKGYPSGAAGGLVLRGNRQFEATALTFDTSRGDPFELRPAYEFTHASNNYAAAQRYINLLDDRAVQRFLAVTHDAYWKRLESHFGSTIQAAFTDEPSLIAVNIGQIPETARAKVRVVDPLDPDVRPLPCVPWCYDLPERFAERFRRDLIPLRRSLFQGDTSEDRLVRRQFWSLVADLVADRYFGAIQTWCGRHRIASSGHGLHEESVLHQTPLEGNAIKSLSRMDIPGLDLLTSDPEAVIHSGWMTAGLPSSAGLLCGRRRVMSETSDFSQRQSGHGAAALPEMQATAAWQAAWGVTDLTLYYSPQERSVETYRAYCDYVGRLNAILKPAQLTPKTLLYYPVYDLWAEYLPMAASLRLDAQSHRAQKLVRSFTRLGQSLQRGQIPFVLIDHENLARASVESQGKLVLSGRAFESLILPEGVELPAEAAVVVERARQGGLRVLGSAWEKPSAAGKPGANGKPAGVIAASSAALIEALDPDCRIKPASQSVALGKFVRQGREIVLVVNVGREPYEGQLTVRKPGGWLRLDPASGAISTAQMPSPDQVRLALAPRQALLLVGADSERK